MTNLAHSSFDPPMLLLQIPVATCTGHIFIRNCVLFDNSRSAHTFTVTAMEDSSIDLGTAMVTIILLDANDNRPVFMPEAYTFQVEENQALPVLIGNVTAEDADSGTNALVRIMPESCAASRVPP